MRLDQFHQASRIVIRLRRNSNQWQSSGLKHLIHKFIPILAITAVVAGIVEFHAAQGSHGRRIADQEIDMLAVDLVPVALVLVGPSHEEDVSQIHLGTDDNPITKGGAENLVERQFRRRQKIISLAVG